MGGDARAEAQDFDGQVAGKFAAVALDQSGEIRRWRASSGARRAERNFK